MVKPLFSPLAPDELDDDPLRPGEKSLHFFQRQSLPEFVEYRQWIEELFQGLPSGHHNAFRGRLRGKTSQFQSALFEMQLYRMLKVSDWKESRLRVEIERELDLAVGSTKKKADFLVGDGCQSCLIEATVCGFGQGILSDTNQEYDAITKLENELSDLDLDILLEAEGKLMRTLRGSEIQDIVSRIKRHLEFFPRSWLEERRVRVLEVARWTVRAAGISATNEECVAEFKADDWTLSWKLAVPPTPRRGQVHGPSRSGAADRFGPLMKCLKEKARHWSGIDLGYPLIVAVNNCHSEFAWNPDGIRCALANDDDATDQSSFLPALHRIAAVIVVGNACMGAELRAPVKLFGNGNKEIPRFLHSLEEERTFGELLGLSHYWGQTSAGAGP